MSIRNLILATGIAGAVIVGAGAAYSASITAPEFVRKASVSGLFEVESSNLALEKSQNTAVREFAKQMIDDHTKANNKLKAVLQTSNTDAKPATALDSEHQKLMDELRAETGESFDRRYIDIQTGAHNDAVGLFNEYANEGEDAALKNFAALTLPTLKEHLNHVKTIHF